MIKITGRLGDFKEGIHGKCGNKTEIHIHTTSKGGEFKFITSNELAKTLDPNYYINGGIPTAYEDSNDNREITIELETIPGPDQMDDLVKKVKAKIEANFGKLIKFKKTG